MTAREFREWVAFDAMEPIGRSRSDYAVAQLTHAVLSVMGGKKLAGDQDDWLPVWTWRDTSVKTGEQLAEEMRARLVRRGQ